MKKRSVKNIINKTRLMSAVVVVLIIGSIVVSGIQTMDNESPKRDETPLHTTVRVSVTSEGLELQGALGSREGTITPDGRFVVFTSDADNLKGYNRSSGRVKQVYVHDRDLDNNSVFDEKEVGKTKTVLISKSTQSSNYEEAGNNVSGGFIWREGDSPFAKAANKISISSDGRFVVFTSYATNFFPGMQSSIILEPHVYLHDRNTSGGDTFDESGYIKTELIDWKIENNNNERKTWSEGAGFPAISDDGTYVLFCTIDPYYLVGKTQGLCILNRKENSYTYIDSISKPIGQASMTPNGRLIVYPSQNTTNYKPELRIYIRETKEDKLLVSSQHNEHCFLWPDISDDGKLIAFTSNNDTLVKNDNNGYYDVFIFDRKIKMISLISISSSGTQSGDEHSGCVDPLEIGVSISPDGNYVAFMSKASNLIQIPKYLTGIYFRDRLAGTTELVSVNSAGHDPNPTNCAWPSVSLQAGYIAFNSDAENFVPGNITGDPRNPWAGDNNDMPDVFVRIRTCSCFYLRGDMDCDGDVDFDDIGPFVLALSGKAAYTAQYPDCCWENADCNGDGKVNFHDIGPFVSLLGN